MAVSSVSLAIWATFRAIWADDNSSSGLGSELAVPTALLSVFERMVWLAERLVITKMPTANNSKTLPVMIPQRVKRRLERLSRAGGRYNWGSDSTIGTFLECLLNQKVTLRITG